MESARHALGSVDLNAVREGELRTDAGRRQRRVERECRDAPQKQIRDKIISNRSSSWLSSACGMCVCIFSHLFWRQSHGSRRNVYFTFAVYSGDYTLQRFVYPSEPTGATQEGVNTGTFFFLICFFEGTETPHH